MKAMPTVTERVTALEKGLKALRKDVAEHWLTLSNHIIDLERRQNRSEEDQTAFGLELTELRQDLTALTEDVTALAALIGTDEGNEVPKPGPITIVVTHENDGEAGMSDENVYRVKAEQTKPQDIERSVITATGPDGIPQVKETGKPELDPTDGKYYSIATDFTGHQGDAVEVTVVNFDDADPPKESEPFTETVTLPDMEAPASAGRVTIEVTEETDV